MKTSSTRRFTLVPWVLGYLLGGGSVAVLAWLSCGCAPPWLTGQNAPAWVQAVGSILAIVAAVMIAWWQQRAARLDLERRDQRDELARYVRATRALQRFARIINRQLGAAEELRGARRSGDLHPIEVPSEVRELEREIHLLSGVSGHTFTAINAFEEAQLLLAHNTLSYPDSQAFVGKLTLARDRCAAAGTQVYKFLEAP